MAGTVDYSESDILQAFAMMEERVAQRRQTWRPSADQVDSEDELPTVIDAGLSMSKHMRLEAERAKLLAAVDKMDVTAPRTQIPMPVRPQARQVRSRMRRSSAEDNRDQPQADPMALVSVPLPRQPSVRLRTSRAVPIARESAPGKFRRPLLEVLAHGMERLAQRVRQTLRNLRPW
jgi:hypothetical protein